jgi:meiotic recombination protein DMC1
MQKLSNQSSEKDEVDEESLSSTTIDKLQEYNINAADINKLKAAGICTVKGLLMVTKKELLNIKGITDVKLEKMLEAAQKVESLGFYKATEIAIKREKIRRISTGSKNLDTMLQGGVESMSITEVFGEFRTGKTQLSHTLCVTAQMATSDGGGNGRVIFIDTENTFRPERISAIAARFDMDPDECLGKIDVGRAYTVDHLNQLLMFAAAKMYEDTYALLIVDSIMAPFRVDFSGRGELCNY